MNNSTEDEKLSSPSCSERKKRQKIQNLKKKARLDISFDYEKEASTSSSCNESDNGHKNRVEKRKQKTKKQNLNRLTKKSSEKQDLAPLDKPKPV